MPSKVTQLFLVKTLTCGLEICMAAGTIYIPPLLLEGGLEVRFVAMVLGMGPVLGLMFVPLIGSASDRWSGRFGRRLPFIWALCTGVLLSLLLIPNASRLVSLLPLGPHWLEMLLLVCSICLMEFCGQACFTPLEALVSDLFPGEAESRQAFSIYSLMISLGGCVGYLLPAVDWRTGGLAVYLGGQEAFIYTLLTLVILLCLLGTAFISEVQTGGEVSQKEPTSKTRPCCTHSFLPQPLYLCWALGSCLTQLPQLYRLCQQVPLVIRRLFVAELCSWMALMTFMLFYTDFIGEVVYKGVPTALPGTQERLLYDEGVRMGSLGLFMQCATSVVFSLLMDRLVGRVGTRVVYLSSMVLLALATLVMCVSRSLFLVTLMASVTGYTFCTLQILPYTLTCLYHSNKQVFFTDSKPKIQASLEETVILPPNPVNQHYSHGHSRAIPGPEFFPSELSAGPPCSLYVSLPLDATLEVPPPVAPQGLCFDMAILDSAYLLSQVVPSLFVGHLVQLTHSVAAYMACASVFSLLAFFFSRKVIFVKSDLE